MEGNARNGMVKSSKSHPHSAHQDHGMAQLKASMKRFMTKNGVDYLLHV